jgi:hypothetical protein
LKKRKSLPKFACIIWFTNDDYAVQMAIWLNGTLR